jgi:hypothetical protein
MKSIAIVNCLLLICLKKGKRIPMYVKNIPLLTFFLLISINLFGQKGFEKGYIITMYNDTLYGNIKDRKDDTFPRIYRKIRFKKDGSLFSKRYSANKIMGYKAGDGVYVSVPLKRESHLLVTHYLIVPNYNKSFLKVVQTGGLSYYHWEYIDSESNTYDYTPLFHKEGRYEMVRVTQGVFGLKKRLLSAYLYDCPELVGKIGEKEIRTPEDVLELYGYFCRD